MRKHTLGSGLGRVRSGILILSLLIAAIGLLAALPAARSSVLEESGSSAVRIEGAGLMGSQVNRHCEKKGDAT